MGTVAPTAPVAERRLVSVVFADLVGFTTAAEDQDPEAVRDFLTLYFDTAREVITRYGGTVEKFIGDAVMAVWGAPTAHDDDAERAVRAALDLVETVARLEPPNGAARPRLRAGILTGEAAVTLGAEGQGMVAGDLVNTASRLQAAAAPGTILVGESTYHAARGAIAFEAAGDQSIKGKALPVAAWRALRVVAEVGGRNRSELLEAPFVGRDEELRLLKEAYHATVREGKARLVSVIGQPGLGKSRLAWEFSKYTDGLVETLLWHEGRSPAYGEGVTFWALAEMVRRRASIAETDDDPTSREKLTACLEDYVADADERRWLQPALAALLGMDDAPQGEREELYAAWRTFFERVSDRAPTVMLFQDLHWADKGLLDFIEHLLEWAANRPILILAFSRPDLLEKHPSWGSGLRRFSSIHLEPLDDSGMTELLIGLAPGLPDSALRSVLARAEGVPLYAVETVRMLVDQGLLSPQEGSYSLAGSLDDLAVPDSLHALIAARLDRLDTPDRGLLQDAAVLGQSFTVAALAALTGSEPAALEPRLKALVHKEFLRLQVDPRSPERGQYQFVQALIREVAYNTLAKRDRRSRHLAAARYFEALGEDELAGLLASHYLDAYRATAEGPEADAAAAQARVALRGAAERAAALHSHEQAVSYLEQALTVTSEPRQRANIFLRAGDSASEAALPEKARDYLSQAMDLYREQSDKSGLAEAASKLGLSMLSSGQVEAAVAMMEKVHSEQAGHDVDVAMVGLKCELARGYMMNLGGDQSRALELADQASAAAEQLGLLPELGEALITKATVLTRTERFQEGLALMRGALSFAEANGLATTEERARNNLSATLVREDPRTGFEIALLGLERGRKLGNRARALWLAGNLLECALWTGDWDRALAVHDEMDREELAPGYRLLLIVPALGIQAMRGEVEAARVSLSLAERLVPTVTDAQQAGAMRLSSTFVSLATGDLEAAYQCATSDVQSEYARDESQVIAGHLAIWLGDPQRLANQLAELEAHRTSTGWRYASQQTLKAGLAALNGDLNGAVNAYRECGARWRGLGTLLDLGFCQMEFAALLPQFQDAEAAAEEARQIFTQLKSPPMLARLDAALAKPSAVPASVGSA